MLDGPFATPGCEPKSFHDLRRHGKIESKWSAVCAEGHLNDESQRQQMTPFLMFSLKSGF
jgi:hypothetical protein